MRIDLLDADLLDSGPVASAESGLADVLVDCVSGGASVGFLAGLTQDEARAWWRGALQDPNSLTWVARDESGRIIGTVRLLLATQPNGAHRAEVAKLLVHRDSRGRGCAWALLSTLEETARKLGRTVLVLDTQTGSPAERRYERMGWQRVGVIEDYAATPDGRLEPTTLMSKRL
ncbi:GNAT family N-acetyltransferase [Planosporangium flavigriseum]|uniref:N-acetyltransferase n=1 Tax=Planosporangium flavigriseum TaxID=373681 RepID=A0A8J3PMJ8_9ACTN|nr:GNAT family N-acetyltransferase [Planosporangium flavigriseum]NJC65910.1 GNAT family N-acetyltransferase [Planosporangium flavigriseum]GIG75616.1 N-acetyltransferase [Planosporangium flavigriseum]